MEIEYGQLQIGINRKYAEDILVETAVDTAERGGAEKILSLEADAKLTGAELLEKEAEVSGKVNYRLLYLDRQKRLCGLDYYKDFKCRVRGEEITPTGKCRVHFLLPDADARIAGDTVELSAVTEICLSYFGEKEEKGVQEVTEAECLKKDVISQSVKRSERQIELEKVADVGPGVKKIVLFAPEAVLGSVEKKDGANTVSGEVRANILYLNEGDEVVEISAVMPFSESFEQKDASYDLTIRNARIVLTDDEGGNVIEAEASLVIEEIEYEEKRGSAVVAVCGERQETEEVAAKAVCERYLGQRVFEEDLSGTIPLDVPDAYVAFVRPGCHALAEVRAEEGVLQVEGVSAFRVIYLTQEGYDAVQGEFPFRFALPFPEAKVGQRAEVSVKITDPKAVPSGKEVAVTAKISFDAVLSEEEGTTYLSEVREGTIRPESEAGISVYFAEKGEDLWQIAKTMGVLPSALVKANPFLADPMDEARKVLIFRSK